MELTREQLYEKLWTDGVGKTEKTLGLKQPELKKLCEDFQIPKPSSNYWISLSLGKSPEKTPLPLMDDSQSIHIEDYIKPKRVKQEKPVLKLGPPQKTPEGKYVPRELPPDEPETIYTVPNKLLAMDPILMDTKQKLRERNGRDNNWSKKNPYKSTPKKWLDITVSEGLEERALRIFATIWRAAEAKDYHLKINVNKDSYYPNCTTYFIVRGYEIRVELREINKRVKDESNTYWSSTKLVGNGCSPKPSARYFKTDDATGLIKIIQANGIYIDKRNLKPRLQNAIRRLAAYSNPQFYLQRRVSSFRVLS